MGVPCVNGNSSVIHSRPLLRTEVITERHSKLHFIKDVRRVLPRQASTKVSYELPLLGQARDPPFFSALAQQGPAFRRRKNTPSSGACLAPNLRDL